MWIKIYDVKWKKKQNKSYVTVIHSEIHVYGLQVKSFISGS